MDKELLATVLRKHREWLLSGNGGGADLGGANLRGADLGGARLGDWYILQLGPLGSRNDYLVYKSRGEFEELMTGCFKGTLEEFLEAVESTHGNNKYGQEYQAAVAFIRARKEVWGGHGT